MARVLILGATGYVGRRLVSVLQARGHEVRCLVRDRRKTDGPQWEGVAVVEGDVLKPETLPPAMADIEVVYYLVHSMSAGERSFASLDREAATNAGTAARDAGVQRLIYLGGLGNKEDQESIHLQSRHEVADVLRESGVPVTEFRAAVVVGAGSTSFEMVHHLVNRLPVMICPRWLMTRTQPIALPDVLRYLSDCLDKPETVGRTIDIGGPAVLNYRDMMLTVAKVLQLRRLLIQVPVLTPKLSSYWVNFVTPIHAETARALIEGLRSDTVCENDDARMMFDFEPMDYEEAVRRALKNVMPRDGRTVQVLEESELVQDYIDPSHLLTDTRTVSCRVTPDRLYQTVSSVGGETGWFYANWLWKIRGALDELLGGVGMRRGRVISEVLTKGDTIDFWAVEEAEENRMLRLHAEMKVWGQAWLEFTVGSDEQGSRLTQIARYYPKGLGGLLYWWATFPVHFFVFRGMARNLCRAAEGDRPDR
ncbi:DUF2867 domain-containing protein [candidate division GN15 bacterium]|nr:DUF2867 domain-containing protein [candidate division GN15 bacterium]